MKFRYSHRLQRGVEGALDPAGVVEEARAFPAESEWLKRNGTDFSSNLTLNK